MSQSDAGNAGFVPVVSQEALKKAEQYIEEEEGAINKLPGRLGSIITLLAVVMSLFHLYAAYGIMPTHVLRGIHVAFVLFLCFLLFPVAKKIPSPHSLVGLAGGGCFARRRWQYAVWRRRLS